MRNMHRNSLEIWTKLFFTRYLSFCIKRLQIKIDGLTQIWFVCVIFFNINHLLWLRTVFFACSLIASLTL